MPDLTNRLQDFMGRNPNVDLLNVDFNRAGATDQLDLGDGPRDAAIETLKTAQRLLRVYPSTAVAAALDAAGLGSAHEIAAIPEHQFVSQYAASFDALDGRTAGVEMARRIHRSAANIVERVRLHTMSLVAFGDPTFAAMSANNASGLLNFYSGLPGYQEMFGTLNYLQCEECQSIWSPAAYFVDLLRLVDGYVTEPKHKQMSLAARRPDLWQIPLTCDSTNQEVPYLQIVNQILEAQVQHRLKRSLIGGPQPAGERQALTFNNGTYINIPDNPFLVPDYTQTPTAYDPPTQFTVCGWVNPAQLSSSTPVLPIMGWGINPSGTQNKPSLYLNYSDEQHSYDLVVALQTQSPSNSEFMHTAAGFFTQANTWVHIAWVFDLTAMQSQIYRNGVAFGPPLSTGEITAIYSDASSAYQIGSVDYKFWDGQIANVGIWLRPLEAEEIVAVMKAEGLPESQSDLASYWLIDDNSSTIKNSAPYAIANQQSLSLSGGVGGSQQWETLQVSSSASYLSANPALTEEPLLYLATQDYPFKLPFNHPLVQIRRLLAHFGTSLAELYSAFLVGNAPTDQPASIAREALALAPEKYDLLTQPTTEDAALQQAYGLAAEDTSLSDLSNADLFLEQTELDDKQLNDLLFQNLRRKRALEFDGTMEVGIGNPPALQALTSDLTIELWLRPADFSDRRNPLCKAYSGEFAVTQEVASESSPSYLQFYYGVTGKSYNGGSAGNLSQAFAIQPNFLNLNQWSHVAIVRDLANATPTLTAYVNGQPYASATPEFPVAVAGDDPVLIGNGYTSPYIGQIADVRIWNKARSSDEIKADMSRRLKGDEPGLTGCWPLDDDIGTSARDLSPNKNYGTVQAITGDLTSPPTWAVTDNLVWDDNEINAQILSQFFINQGLSAGQYLSLALVDNVRAIVVNDPATGTSAPLNSAATFDRLNRFIRLAQSLEWSFADLDLALRSIEPAPSTEIDEKAIRKLAAMKKLQARLGLQVDEMCALWSNMNTFGIGNGTVAEDLFDRTFNYPTSFVDPTGLAGTPPYRPQYSADPLYTDTVLSWTPNDRTTPQASTTRSRLRGALGIEDDDLTQISNFLLNAQAARQESSVSIPLTVDNLSKHYRYSTLARALGLPVAQLLALLRLLQISEIDSIEKVSEAVDWVDWMQAAGLNVAQLDYLTTGTPNAWVKTGYDEQAVASLLAEMIQESQSLLLTPTSFAAATISQDQAETIFQQLQTDGAIDQNGVVLTETLGPEPPSRPVLKFNGTSNTIVLPNNPFVTTQNDPVTQFTICAWANPAMLNPSAILPVMGYQNNTANLTKPTLYMNTGTTDLVALLQAENPNSSTFTQTAEGFFSEANAWVHIAWVFDLEAQQSRIYRNGVLFGEPLSTGEITAIYSDASTDYQIGNANFCFWSGEVANVGVWQRPLDQSEIVAALHARRVPRAKDGLTGYWMINEATGNSIADSVGSNNGTLQGTAVWTTADDVIGQAGTSKQLELFVRETLTLALVRQDLYVTQKLAAFFSVQPGVMAAAQALAILSHGHSLWHINRLLTVPPDGPVPTAVSELMATLALDLYLAAALGLTPIDVVGIASQPAAFSLGEFGSSFQWTLTDLRVIWRYKQLTAAFGGTSGQVIVYFELASRTGPHFVEAAQSKLAAISGWPSDQIALLEEQVFWPAGWTFATVEQVAALKRCFDLAASLGAGIDLMLTLRGLNVLALGSPGTPPSLPDWESYKAVAHDLSQVVAARYGNSVAPQVMSSIEGQLEQLKRDVLVAFLLWELRSTYSDMRTSDDLYDFLLIDVDMSSIVEISQMKAGLNSLQLYVESTMMGLEAEVVNQIPRLWWRWMANYRVWQANREVFLYPENYIDPLLRKSKTPPFKQLESDLQQGSLTPPLVESALAGYLEGFSEVANLEIVASYRARVKTPASTDGAQGIDTLFLFGRTRTNPPTFYYRTLRLFDGAHVEQAVWTPWQQINLSINAARITPIYAFDKLFIFWVEQSTKNVNLSNSNDQQQSVKITSANLYFSFQKLDRSWMQTQTLEQNLPIDVNLSQNLLAYPYPNAPTWKHVRVLLDDSRQQIIILYGDVIGPPLHMPDQPTPTGNAEIDEFAYMIYDSMVFANKLPAGYMTSLVPLWTLGNTLARGRANLQFNPQAENACTGRLTSDNQLEYGETWFFDFLRRGDVFEVQPQHFLPLNGNYKDVIYVNTDATAQGSPTWTTDPTCPLGSERSVLSMSGAGQTLSESFSALSGSLTVQLWTYAPQGLTATFGDTDGYELWTYDNAIWAGNANNTHNSSAAMSLSSDWVCIAFVVDATTNQLTLYQNGQFRGQTAITLSSISQFAIYFSESGKLANIAIWNGALTATDLATMANHPLTLLTTGISAFAARAKSVGNQPGWFTFENGDEAFLVAPLVPGTNGGPANGDLFKSLQQITTVKETPATGSGRGVNRPIKTITFGNAAADPSTFTFADLNLKFIRLTTHTVADLEQRLLVGGPDMLLSLASQLTPELPFSRFTPTAQVIAPASRLLDFNGAYGEYFWELFFYTPFLIANTFATNQRFQLAQKWFQYIFDPTYSADNDGLAGYWPLNGNADDLAGPNDGTLEVDVEPFFISTTFADGSIREVMTSPDNHDNNVHVSGAASLNITQAITLEGWCYFYDIGGDQAWIIQKEIDGEFNNPWYVYRLSINNSDNDTGVFTFSVAINGTDANDNPVSYKYVSVSSSSLLAATNQWYYVAGTFDGSELCLYVNGQPIGKQKLSTLSTAILTPATIGTSGQPVKMGGDSFYGQLAEVRIWNRALSSSDILAHYLAPQPQDRFWRFRPFLNRSLATLNANLSSPQQLAVYAYDPFDADALARLRAGANEKGIVMRYVANLIKWGNRLFAQYTWETITEATMLYTESLDLLGPMPRQVGDVPAPPVKTSLDFVKEYGGGANVPPFLIQLEHGISPSQSPAGQTLPGLPFNLLNSYFCVPVNKALLALWQEVDSQLYKIRHGENIQGQPQPLPLFEPPLNPAALVKAGGSSPAGSSRPPAGSPVIPYYRFSYLIGQVKDFSSQVIQLGSALLGALERQDAEQLALMQNNDEATILNLTTQIKQDQINGLEQTGQSLQAALSAAQQRQQTYATWLQGPSGSSNGASAGQSSSSVSASWNESLSPAEDVSLITLAGATELHAAAALMRIIASPLYLLPDIFGLADGGMNFGGSVDAIAGMFDNVGSVLTITSQVAGMVGQFQRRDQEWLLQYQLATDDIAQIQAQIEANQTALASAQRDLQIHQQQITQNQAIGNFYRTKFTNEQLYQWMAGQLSTIYFQAYQLAFDLAQEAQMAFQYEQNSQKNYLNYGAWDSLEKGLTAGDSLMFSLNQLEKGNLDAGQRHLEIEKTISLLQTDPQAVIALKTTGQCSFALTERLFDYDFPGQYNRKISTLSITIPAIVGPYQNIHATLVQTSNRVVLQADINAVEYLLSPKGNNGSPPLSIRSNWNVSQQVALSRGTDDSGLFVLDFNDPRYLPFEGTGAISTWRLTMLQAANPIDFNSISDVIIKLSYRAQDGGDSFQQSVMKLSSIQSYSGLRFISLRQMFPEAWHNFLHTTAPAPTLQFPISRAMFPLNLKPGSVMLGSAEAINSKPAGLIRVQWTLAQGDDSNLPDLSLNGQAVADNVVALAAPGQPLINAPVPLSDFGIDNLNTLTASGALPKQVLDVVLIIPFDGQLNWPVSS
ncbi:MAG: hypothetical protein V7641_3103 [Blastocatellia bacterium]